MSSSLVVKDAAWQLIGRLISALFGFLTIKIITPYLGPLRYGDYSTILKFFAIWTALADLGLYVLAVKKLGEIKEKNKDPEQKELKEEYGKFVGTRLIIMSVIYTVALVVAYLLPAYTSNPYIVWGLPLGMIFSASFMFAGIQQLPLQIFWKMKWLSISLITARLSQLLVLVPVVYLFFRYVDFSSPSRLSLFAFCLILFSVVASGIGQNLEIHYRAQKLLSLKIRFDWSFTKAILKKNRKYGVSYYLSSFHTLIVLLFFGWFFPTSHGFSYTGIWALALSLIEILLIIPSSLGNSLLHKISGYTDFVKRKNIGNLLQMVVWIGGIIAVNFWLFSASIIQFVGGKKFLGDFENITQWGSDQVLPFLGVVLFFSFIKQVFNYLFVSLDKQNLLLGINGFGVLCGVGLGIFVIPRWGLLGGVVTQLLIEFLFMLGAIVIAIRKSILPVFDRKQMIYVGIILFFALLFSYFLKIFVDFGSWTWLLWAFFFNFFVLGISRIPLKKIVHGLGIDALVEEKI